MFVTITYRTIDVNLQLFYDQSGITFVHRFLG